jgi:hypothetical protein
MSGKERMHKLRSLQLFKCDDCDLEFNSQLELFQHAKIVHPALCLVCGKHYIKLAFLEEHLQAHTIEEIRLAVASSPGDPEAIRRLLDRRIWIEDWLAQELKDFPVKEARIRSMLLFEGLNSENFLRLAKVFRASEFGDALTNSFSPADSATAMELLMKDEAVQHGLSINFELRHREEALRLGLPINFGCPLWEAEIHDLQSYPSNSLRVHPKQLYVTFCTPDCLTVEEREYPLWKSIRSGRLSRHAVRSLRELTWRMHSGPPRYPAFPLHVVFKEFPMLCRFSFSPWYNEEDETNGVFLFKPDARTISALNAWEYNYYSFN